MCLQPSAAVAPELSLQRDTVVEATPVSPGRSYHGLDKVPHPPGTMKVGSLFEEIPRDIEWWEMWEVSYPQGQPGGAFPNISPPKASQGVVGCSRGISRDTSTDPSTKWSVPWSCCGKSSGPSPSISGGFTWWVQRHPWPGSASEVITSRGL